MWRYINCNGYVAVNEIVEGDVYPLVYERTAVETAMVSWNFTCAILRVFKM